jgi:4-amino-4-deoxy-L-arabinose transferase-like glycosyltransferase
MTPTNPACLAWARLSGMHPVIFNPANACSSLSRSGEVVLSSLRCAARTWLPMVAILLAWAVRVQNLAYHSLWFDEAMSVHWARSEVSRILEVGMNLVEDRLPPLYYLLLHGWRQLAGDGDVAVRLPSVIAGLLLVAVSYRLAAELFGRRVALLSVALVALNPFLVWYSQEARMYALAVLLGTCGTWCLVRAAGAPAARRVAAIWWAGYGLCVLAGLYTHFYTGLLVPAHALYLVWTWRRAHRAWLPFVAVSLVVGGLFMPLALAAARASAEAGPGHPLDGLGERLWALLASFTVWKAPLAQGAVVTIGGLTGLLALLGLWPVSSEPHPPAPYPLCGEGGIAPLHRMKRRSGCEVPSARTLLALLLVIPLALATLLLLRTRLAFFGERYFIGLLPWLLMAVALGAIRLADQAGGLPGALRLVTPALCWGLPLVLTLIPLPGQWSPPARKEAWRETVAYLATHARAEDAIVIHPDWTRYPLQYYFRGPGQTYAVFSSVDGHTDLDGPLTTITGRHPVVWLIESHTELADPEHRVNAWLAARYPLVTELYPPGIAVHAYAPGYLTDHLPDFATSLLETRGRSPYSVSFQGGLRLAGYMLPETRVRPTDDLFHPPSGWVKVVTYWEAETALDADYTPFVHLVDEIGQVWGASLERGNDAFQVYPTTRWLPGQVVRADFDVNLNPVTPAGDYTLVAGLRDDAGNQVALTDGTAQAVLAPVEVVE